MQSRDKIKNYYARKNSNNYTKYRHSTKSNKLFKQAVFSIIIIVIFIIFLRFQNISYFNKIISTTKSFIENNINLDSIEAFANTFKIFNNSNETNVQVDPDLLEELKEELYSESVKK